MVRRETVTQASLVLALVCGIVGGNFVLHRWMLGNVASREVNAGTSLEVTTDELDLAEFAPRKRLPMSDDAVGSEGHAVQLRKLIAEKLPQATDEERIAWEEELRELSLTAAAGVLDLRERLRANLGK